MKRFAAGSYDPIIGYVKGIKIICFDCAGKEQKNNNDWELIGIDSEINYNCDNCQKKLRNE